MTTTINHKIRLELELTCEEYTFLDMIYQSKKKVFKPQDFYVKIGFDIEQVVACFKSTKRLLKFSICVVETTDEWNKYFDKKKGFEPPTQKEVIDFFKEKGYKESAGKKAWEYYDAADWNDSTGKKIKSWKQKMIGVWFKDENKSPKIAEPVIECPYTSKQLWEAQHYYESDGIVPSWFDKQYLHLIKNI